MKVVELFSGKQFLSNEFMRRGHKAVTVDNGSIDGLDSDEAGTDIVADILQLSVDDLPHDVDVVWASPPCTTFSRASMGHHWDTGKMPANTKNLANIRLVWKTLYLINTMNPTWWFLENPVGMIDHVLPQEPHTITYCQYGHDSMKPTYLYGEHPPSFEYRRCSEGDGCHVAAPRGSDTGTQSGDKSAADRSALPQGLVDAVVDACEQPLDGVAQQQTVKDVLQNSGDFE